MICIRSTSKILKFLKTQPRTKKSTSKTCVIMTSFKQLDTEETNEERSNKC